MSSSFAMFAGRRGHPGHRPRAPSPPPRASRAARGDRQRVSVLAERARDGKPDPARGSGDQGGALCHGMRRGPYSATAARPSRRLQAREPIHVPLAALCCSVLAALVAAGCGDSDDDDGDEAAPPPAKAEDFPDPAGKTLAELREGLGPGPVLAPSVSRARAGREPLRLRPLRPCPQADRRRAGGALRRSARGRAGARARSPRGTSRSRSSRSSRARA